MKILICAFVLAAGINAQTSAPASAPAGTQTPAKPPAKKIVPLTVPKDAVETEPGFYRWSDKDGKVWTYRRTPFGVVRWPADAISVSEKSTGGAAEVPSALAGVRVSDAGESVRFERDTPFGKKVWTRKKSELNADEKALWASQQNSSAHAAEKE